jgi:hypothetical protein
VLVSEKIRGLVLKGGLVQLVVLAACESRGHRF